VLRSRSFSCGPEQRTPRSPRSQRARKAEPRQHGVVEARNRTQVVAADRNDEKTHRMENAGHRVADVDTEGGLAVRARRNQAILAILAEDHTEEPMRKVATLVLERRGRYPEPSVCRQQLHGRVDVVRFEGGVKCSRSSRSSEAERRGGRSVGAGSSSRMDWRARFRALATDSSLLPSISATSPFRPDTELCLKPGGLGAQCVRHIRRKSSTAHRSTFIHERLRHSARCLEALPALV
jgi:hypothetical protein